MIGTHRHREIAVRPSLVSLAIILRARPFGESDKIITFLTESHGKITGIAKGALRSRKRFANSLEPFSLVNLTFQERPHSSLAFVAGSELIHSPHALLGDLDRVAQASYLVEISEGLIAEREENCAVFYHLKAGLDHLERAGASLRFLTAFELKLLRLTGYQPGLELCKKCQKSWRENSLSWYLSSLDGGIVCDDCSRGCRDLLPLDRTAVQILTSLQAEDDSLPSQMSLPVKVVADMRAAVQRFVELHVGREIKSASFLQSFSTS